MKKETEQIKQIDLIERIAEDLIDDNIGFRVIRKVRSKDKISSVLLDITTNELANALNERGELDDVAEEYLAKNNSNTIEYAVKSLTYEKKENACVRHHRRRTSFERS